jgi:hypothetical protein
VARRGGARAGHHRDHDVLRLQEPDVALEEAVREERRDHPPREGAGLRRDVGVLPEQGQDRLGVEPDDGEGDARHRQDDHGALLVDAQQAVLPGSVRLPAQRVQGACHSKLIEHAADRESNQRSCNLASCLVCSTPFIRR